jgi:hypothetical protein
LSRNHFANGKTKPKSKSMKQTKTFGAVLVAGLTTFLLALALIAMPTPARASGGTGGGGGGGGGGGTQVANFSGNWSGTITTSFGTGLFTMAISESSTGALNGSAHFGAPIFDATLKLSAMTLDGVQFSGFVFNSKGGDAITGTLSPDGKTITGTVNQGEIYTYTVSRN